MAVSSFKMSTNVEGVGSAILYSNTNISFELTSIWTASFLLYSSISCQKLFPPASSRKLKAIVIFSLTRVHVNIFARLICLSTLGTFKDHIAMDSNVVSKRTFFVLSFKLKPIKTLLLRAILIRPNV